MKATISEPRWERLLAPRALFVGIAVAFAACCVAGHVAGRINYMHHFARFHNRLSPESLYYPTARQVRSFGRDCLDPNKIVVVVGGSSVLHGTGQRVDHVWTKHLQELLGDDYQVVNFALRCGQTGEFGEIAAEILQRDHPKLIFVSDTHPGSLPIWPDGSRYRYFYWDAYNKKLTVTDAARDAQLAKEIPDTEKMEQEVGKKRAIEAMGMLAEQQRELHTAMALDRGVYFHDLWNTVAYRWFHTMWTPPTRESFRRARKGFADNDPGPPPLETRYAQQNDWIMSIVRANLYGCVKDAAGNWVEDRSSPVWAELERRAAVNFPEPTHRRTLVLAMWFSPYYCNQLSPDERAVSAQMSRSTVQHLEKIGFKALGVGQDFLPADYADWQHLTETGGEKLATAVAPAVRELAQSLGYTQGGRKQ
jgi:hypothetical protein